MADFSRTSDSELRSRIEFLLRRLDDRLRAVAPFLRQIAHDREESSLVLEEMRKRGLIRETALDVTSAL